MNGDFLIGLEREFLREALGLLILVGFGWATAALTGLSGAARRWLEAHNQKAAADMLSTASGIVQNALDNEAGRLKLRVANGELDPGNLRQMNEAIGAAAMRVRGKVGESVETLKGTNQALAEGVEGKLGNKIGPQTANAAPVVLTPVPVDPAEMPKGDYVARANWAKRHFQVDLELKDFQAAGLVGNLGEESGLEAVQERGVTSQGGFGWAQWTGPRRRAFEAWCAAKGFAVTDDRANYQYVLFELRGPEAGALAALRATTTVEEAAMVVSAKYERPGTPRNDKRIALAKQVLG